MVQIQLDLKILDPLYPLLVKQETEYLFCILLVLYTVFQKTNPLNFWQ